MYPKISVITPSFNQGKYIEETILSVIGQHYPNLEYIIIDGGSTDNTLNVLKKYSDKISYWISEKDNGQANAINKGFEKATGDILCWLNSDDLYLPGTLNYISQTLDVNQQQIVFGNSIHFNSKNDFFLGSNVLESSTSYRLTLVDYIIQPSTFWTRKTLEVNGNLNEKLNYVFDWDWFIAAQNKNVIFKPVEKYLSIYRIHPEHKSGIKNNLNRDKEIIYIYEMYEGKKISTLCIKLKPKAEKIRQFKYYLNKLKLQKLEILLLKIIFPSFYIKHPPTIINSLIKML